MTERIVNEPTRGNHYCDDDGYFDPTPAQEETLRGWYMDQMANSGGQSIDLDDNTDLPVIDRDAVEPIRY